jgi:hypothetical protein
MSALAPLDVIDEHLHHHGRVIVAEAERAGLELALACALVEQESGGENIFGCDSQNFDEPLEVPFCRVRVTRERVQELIRHIDAWGTPNGVGLTQLTTPSLVKRAESLGGAHLPRFQCRVGFEYLMELMEDLGKRKGIGAYNGGPGAPNMEYAAEVLQKRNEWRWRLS